MAKKAMVEKNKRRERLVKKTAGRRERLKAIANDNDLPPEERYRARIKLAEMPRNGNPTRIKNRCDVSGRPHAFYRKLKMSRIALRELGSQGLVPGLVKSSW